MRNDGRSWRRGQGRGQGIVGRHVFDCEITTAVRRNSKRRRYTLGCRFCPLSSCLVRLSFSDSDLRNPRFVRVGKKFTIELFWTMNLLSSILGLKKG